MNESPDSFLSITVARPATGRIVTFSIINAVTLIASYSCQ